MFDADFESRILNGDRTAYDELFRNFYPRLLSFAKAYTRNNHVAENIVQDAFLLLWERRETLRPGSNSRAWMLTVVKNNTLNYINRQKRQIDIENTYASQITRELNLRIYSLKACDPENIFSKEVEAIIHKALQALPEQSRKVITMSRFEDMSNMEIAQKLNITVKGVEYHITRSLKFLRTELKDYLLFLLFFA